MTKFASVKKIHTKIILANRNLELNDLGFLCYSKKACFGLSGFNHHMHKMGPPETQALYFWQLVLLKKCQKAQIPCIPPF